MTGTLGDILLRGMERFAARDAVSDPQESLTYAALGSSSLQLAHALRRLGLSPGERSLVALPNSVDFVRAHFANLLAGAVSVPCDAGLTAETLRAVSARCTPRFLLTHRATLQRLGATQPLPPELEHVIVLDDPGDGGAHDGRALAAAEESRPLAAGRAPDDLAALMYTTGTTGKPKGVMLSHANVLAAIDSIIEFAHYSERDREVVILPLSHSFGLGHLYCNLASGGAVYTEPGLARVKRVLNALESFGATGFPGTPTGFGMLIDHFGPVLAKKGAALRFAVINSAPLSPERTSELQQLLPQLDIMVYYGLTEASRSTFISLTTAGPSHYRSVGRPMQHAEVRVQQEGRDVATGDTGEIVIRGAAVSRGYWMNPEEESVTFRDGWLHTGDLGRIDADGYVWIAGRIKDVVNVGGYKVLPGEVEGILRTFPGIHDVGVAGVPAGTDDELLSAGVVADADFAIDEGWLQRACLERLEKFKVPARFVRITAVPRTDTGKVKRTELSAALKDALSRAET
jgi:long-chain acyl-CoA synthetase